MRSTGMTTSDNLPKPEVIPYATAWRCTKASTCLRLSLARSRATGANDTGAERTATENTSSMVSAVPSSTTGVVMGRNVSGPRRQFKVAGQRAKRRSAIPVRRPAIVELQLGLWLQRDEEREGEVPVRRVRETEVRAPIMKVALQRH